MRIGREDWQKLLPEDVAWVTEWQLAYAFRWVPIGSECGVYANTEPNDGGRGWEVSIRLGRDTVTATLPLRDLARLVCWCHGVQHVQSLLYPPAWVRASMHAVQRALSNSLGKQNPLYRMGYADGEPHGLDRGGPSR